MNESVARYIDGFDELNILSTVSFYSSKSVEQTIDDVLSLLIRAYALGVRNAGEMLDYALLVDTDKMQSAIYKVIDGKTFEDRVRNHVEEDDLEALIMLTENEYTRVYNTAVIDGGLEVSNATSQNVTKTWVTVMDNRVRDTHAYLEGNSVAVGQDFYTYDGDHASYPHGFSKAENNVGCRCTVILH